MNASRRLIRALAAATALGVGSLALTACTSGPGSEEEADGKVNVVASFYPLQFLAQQIGAGHVEVESLTKPGSEPHDLELSPQQTGRLTDSDLVVYLKGLQPAVDEGVQQAEPEHVAEASSYTSLEKHSEDVHGEDQDKDHEGHGEDHGHSHSDSGQGGDPHVWLDPVRYAQIAEGVGKKLAEADPAHKKDYEKNTRALTERLHSLDKEFKKGLSRKKTDTFITTHAAFGYLAERYGLHQAAVSGIDPESEPSGARMKKLHKIAKADDVDTVFFESSASDKTARTLANDLNLRTGVLSPLETVKKGQDYFSVMHQNLFALQNALGAP
ncbi:ABC transporter substrate-binding protein [Streptomyces abyssalis]|uniref:ABC transporter substrate-binding protein n=2 Tax=Streptomyces abyssalis TaxID=933944 RepID=A0A1E7JK34_9ACTN|nr:metal ABC transporter substrate-binding protein [Streptomyces abyssalis]OEU88007.1 ABC transporter substrate-binding protein [Streptomyces abyssalis]OEU90869.1 ABC transporter substrate-binding protein [Streptomyces abyssalis]